VYTSFCDAQIAENRLRVCPAGACSRRRLLCIRGIARLLETMDWTRFCPDASLCHRLSAPAHFCFLYRLRGNRLGRLRSVRSNWVLQYRALRSSRSSGRQFVEEIKMNRWMSTRSYFAGKRVTRHLVHNLETTTNDSLLARAMRIAPTRTKTAATQTAIVRRPKGPRLFIDDEHTTAKRVSFASSTPGLSGSPRKSFVLRHRASLKFQTVTTS
jgi:hypothetical protein